MNRCAFDRLKEVSAFAVVAPGGFGEVLEVLGRKVGMDQPAKGSGLWGFRLLSLG